MRQVLRVVPEHHQGLPEQCHRGKEHQERRWVRASEEWGHRVVPRRERERQERGHLEQERRDEVRLLQRAEQVQRAGQGLGRGHRLVRQQGRQIRAYPEAAPYRGELELRALQEEERVHRDVGRLEEEQARRVSERELPHRGREAQGLGREPA